MTGDHLDDPAALIARRRTAQLHPRRDQAGGITVVSPWR